MFSIVNKLRERLVVIKERVQEPSDIQGVEMAVYDLTERLTEAADKKFRMGYHYPPIQSIEEMYKEKAQAIKNKRYNLALEDVYRE